MYPVLINILSRVFAVNTRLVTRISLKHSRFRETYRNIQTMGRKTIIDCDPGNDDAMAILMALSCSDVDVIAITCVEGNTLVKQCGLNALRVLQAADRMDIPVFVGCDSPLLGERKSSSPYHGDDGLGNVPDPSAPDDSFLQQEHAVTALIRLSKQYQDDVHLVAIGPLTNVAMAIRMDSKFGTRFKSCNIMGGNYQGVGNVSPCGEFNFYFDAEAAYVVLNQLKCPITIVPWETCVQHAISFETHTRHRSYNTKKAKLLKAVDKHSIEHVLAKGHNNFIPADEALMACFVNADVIKKTIHMYATVETKGGYTIGQMVIDWRKLLNKEPNVTIVTDLDQTLYEQTMENALK